MILLLLQIVLCITIVYCDTTDVKVNSVNLISDMVSFYRTYLTAGILL